MSAASWLQFVVAHRGASSSPRVPLGRYMATGLRRRREGARATGSSGRSSGSSTGSAASTRSASSAGPTYAYSLLGFSICLVPRRLPACSGSRVAAAQPDRRRQRRPAPVVQHRGQLHDQHELAVLRRRGDDEPPHPDGRADGAELRVRRRRHGHRRRADPRPGPPAGLDDRQLLGRPDPHASSRILLPLSFVVALVLVSQGVIQNFHGFTSAHTVEGAPSSSSRAARSPARSPSSSSAPTAAGSST